MASLSNIMRKKSSRVRLVCDEGNIEEDGVKAGTDTEAVLISLSF